MREPVPLQPSCPPGHWRLKAQAAPEHAHHDEQAEGEGEKEMNPPTEQLAPTPIVDAAVDKCFSKPVTVEEANFIDTCARQLARELAAERAAREKSDARLAEAIKALDFIYGGIMWRKSPDAKGDHLVPDHQITSWCVAIKDASTTPPPILAEVERLREWFKNNYDIERCEFSPQEWQQWRDIYKEKWESAEAQLQIAREDGKRLDWLEKTKLEWHGHWGGGDGAGEPSSWQHPSAEWNVRHTVRDGTGKYPKELKRMTVREAIDAALAQITGKEQS